jgi:hypothetical protein
VAWRSRQDESPQSPRTATAALVTQLESGSAKAEARLIAAYANSEGDAADEVLNLLALSAADGSPYALELLLGLMTDHRLAAPAISRHVRNSSVAEEVEQEVLIAVARSIHGERTGEDQGRG